MVTHVSLNHIRCHVCCSAVNMIEVVRHDWLSLYKHVQWRTNQSYTYNGTPLVGNYSWCRIVSKFFFSRAFCRLYKSRSRACVIIFPYIKGYVKLKLKLQLLPAKSFRLFCSWSCIIYHISYFQGSSSLLRGARVVRPEKLLGPIPYYLQVWACACASNIFI